MIASWPAVTSAPAWEERLPVGGALVDIAALAVIVAFGWAGYQLGLVRSSIRLAAALGAAALAILLQSPMQTLLVKLTPFSTDFCSLLGMLLVAAVAYLAVATIVTYYAGWVPHERLESVDRALGAVPGVVLGLCWVAVMMSLFVLTPTNNFISRWSISSGTGGVLITRATGTLEWLNDKFPHYTQTLPKGKDGAVVHNWEGSLPIRLQDDPSNDPDQAGELLAYLNAFRDEKDASELIWNLEIANVATGHSRSMFNDAFLGVKSPGGVKFEDRMKGALGNNVGLYEHFGTEVVWAHDAVRAYTALIKDAGARELLVDRRLTEVGIGVADGGWFNGTMFTIGLIGREPRSTQDENAAAGGGGAAGTFEEGSPEAEAADPTASASA